MILSLNAQYGGENHTLNVMINYEGVLLQAKQEDISIYCFLYANLVEEDTRRFYIKLFVNRATLFLSNHQPFTLAVPNRGTDDALIGLEYESNKSIKFTIKSRNGDRSFSCAYGLIKEENLKEILDTLVEFFELGK